MEDAPLTIAAAARSTGLSAHVIRVWEKRYAAVTPVRTKSNRRLYARDQVERLRLLARLTQAGRPIGTIAQLPTDTLRALAAEEAASPAALTPPSADRAAAFLEQCIDAVRTLNAPALEAQLAQAETTLGAQGMLQRVAAPLAQQIGDLWRDGSITAAHEHFASAVLRVILSRGIGGFAGNGSAPVLVVVTPAGQLHELGALLAGALAVNLGWRVVYLGASLPAAEIAGAAQQHQARAVALSLVYPEDDPHLPGELIRLRNLLPPRIALLAGGRAMTSYRSALDQIGALQSHDLAHFGSHLDALRHTEAVA